MIPKLYEKDITRDSQTLICYLPATFVCEVTEERNGVFELYMQYPQNGINYSEIQHERIIQAKANMTMEGQFFRIYRITKPINGIVTVFAQHISYDLCNYPIMPIKKSVMSPLSALSSVLSGAGFNYLTDYSDAKEFGTDVPMSSRALLGGSEGSLLSHWHGEFYFNNFRVFLYQHRGEDKGVTVEYGKNLTDLEYDTDSTTIYTELLPYAVFTVDDAEKVLTLPEKTLPITNTDMARKKTLIMDFSSFFDNEVTEDQLRAAASDYITNNILGAMIPSIKISYEPHTENNSILESVSLCDTVTVKYLPLGIEAKSKVVTTVYDSLLERYISITLGEPKSSMVDTISEKIESVVEKAESESKNHFSKLLKSAITNATDKITGQQGGYVVINTDPNGKPYEILILDNEDIDEAVNVWRWNSGGLGFSSSGYDGPYDTAITSDGEIVADFITTGSLTANLIKAGVISSLDGTSWWDLESGELHLSSYAEESELEIASQDIAGLRTDITQHTEKIAGVEETAEGLNRYVAAITEDIETVTDELGNQSEKIVSAHKEISNLSQRVDAIRASFTEQYIGGINFIRNSAGLNGMSDDWTYEGTVRTMQGEDAKNNTVSNSCFALSEGAKLIQTVSDIVPGQSYRLTIKAKKEYGTYEGYFKVTYNGDVEKFLFKTNDSFDWDEFSEVLTDVEDSNIIIEAYSNKSTMYVSDIMLSEGELLHKWTPAPNEIYTTEVKIDHRGIEVTNSESSQRTVITNEEFAGYYNDEVIFTLNKDETQTKKTTVDGELTVGKVKFIPLANSGSGLNIVVLD